MGNTKVDLGLFSGLKFQSLVFVRILNLKMRQDSYLFAMNCSFVNAQQ